MSQVLSIDLACSAKNVGICVLREDDSSILVDFPSCAEMSICDPFDSQLFADRVFDYCRQRDISIVIIDGPQAWKDSDSLLEHCRACEMKVHTPAKTGPKGCVKPATWTRFVAFSIGVFASLTKSGARLAHGAVIQRSAAQVLALESFPTGAWRSLGLTPLPGKAKSKKSDVVERTQILEERLNLRRSKEPNHDELQALVAALAGLGVTGQNCKVGYQAHGVPPFMRDGSWLEGFIVNPIWLSR